MNAEDEEVGTALGSHAQQLDVWLAMSLRGTGGIWGRRGAIAYHVLTHAATPVLGLPRRQLGGPLATRLRRAVNKTLLARDRIEMAGIDALLSAGSGETRLKR